MWNNLEIPNQLSQLIEREYSTKTVYPEKHNIFKAFELTPFEQVRVVILGQDPYHNPEQANGLAFSVSDGQKLPPSLKNIFKEMYAQKLKDIPQKEHIKHLPMSGNLDYLAKQGVLLLNSILIVERNQPLSYAKCGFEEFTTKAIELLNQSDKPIVFMLWGNNAIAMKSVIDNPRHLVLTTTHPSPLSASKGFLGCGHFTKANEFLSSNGLSKVEWCNE